MRHPALVVLFSVVFALWISAELSRAQDNNAGLSAGGAPKLASFLQGTASLSKPPPVRSLLTPQLLLIPSQLQLAQSCPADAPVDCGEFCCGSGTTCMVSACCGGTYCGGDLCCASGYSCETECHCRPGQGYCTSGCCPSDRPHTCAESDRCFTTAQDAVDNGCTWASVEVCGVAVQ
jgi:hypothetical protein